MWRWSLVCRSHQKVTHELMGPQHRVHTLLRPKAMQQSSAGRALRTADALQPSSAKCLHVPAPHAAVNATLAAGGFRQ